MAEADDLDRASDRWLAGEQAALRDAARQLRQMVDRRTEILVAGGVSLKTAREVLAGGPTSAVNRGNVADLKVGDAVSAGGADYTVSGRLRFNDRGVQWSRLQLKAGADERWLLTLNGGLDNYWLTPTTPPADMAGSPNVTLDSVNYTLRSEGTAQVDLEGLGGERRGLLIDYRRFGAGDDSILWGETWPGGQVFAFSGERVGQYELDVFQQRNA
jgi:hypothetical protein